jgi:hypothetical protein
MVYSEWGVVKFYGVFVEKVYGTCIYAKKVVPLHAFGKQN